MSSVKTRAPRRLERYRGKKQGPKIQEKQGRGKAVAIAATKINIADALRMKKVNSKATRELEAMDVAALQVKLAEARRALLDLRFKHAVAQLENVAAIPATKRLIARILTLIQQKEVGA